MEPKDGSHCLSYEQCNYKCILGCWTWLSRMDWTDHESNPMCVLGFTYWLLNKDHQHCTLVFPSMSKYCHFGIQVEHVWNRGKKGKKKNLRHLGPNHLQHLLNSFSMPHPSLKLNSHSIKLPVGKQRECPWLLSQLVAEPLRSSLKAHGHTGCQPHKAIQGNQEEVWGRQQPPCHVPKPACPCGWWWWGWNNHGWQ